MEANDWRRKMARGKRCHASAYPLFNNVISIIANSVNTILGLYLLRGRLLRGPFRQTTAHNVRPLLEGLATTPGQGIHLLDFVF
jgi:hypothetical protein